MGLIINRREFEQNQLKPHPRKQTYEKNRVIVRPSGTEPKIKCYIEVVTNQVSEATTILDAVEREFRALMAVN